MPPSLRYARIERERRFLLARRPLDMEPLRSLAIVDRYLRNTGLRLRLVDEPPHPAVYKLGQKVRFGDESPVYIAHTTMYISPVEYGILAAVPADELRKTRHVVPAGAAELAVDEFHAELDTLVLAEIDLGSTSVMPFRLPVTPVAEVTDDDRFTGAALATTSRQALAATLSEYGL